MLYLDFEDGRKARLSKSSVHALDGGTDSIKDEDELPAMYVKKTNSLLIHDKVQTTRSMSAPLDHNIFRYKDRIPSENPNNEESFCVGTQFFVFKSIYKD